MHSIFQIRNTKCMEMVDFPRDGHIPYTAKLSSGKTFAVFAVFQLIAIVFP